MTKCVAIGRTPFLRSHVVRAFLWNAVFLLLALLFGRIKYEVSDDFVMESILAGAYNGEPNPYMMFVSVFLGYLLKSFYILFPQVSWYLIGLLLTAYLSLTAITYVIIKRTKGVSAAFLSCLLLCVFSNDVYILVQFTKTAALAVAGGGMLYLWGEFGSHSRKERWLGALLLLLGILIRYYSFFIVAPFLFLMVLFEVRKFWEKRNPEERKADFHKLYGILLRGLLLLGAVFCLRGQIGRAHV